MGVSSGLYGLEQVHQRVLKESIRDDGIKGYSLDTDVTGICGGEKKIRLFILASASGADPTMAIVPDSR